MFEKESAEHKRIIEQLKQHKAPNIQELEKYIYIYIYYMYIYNLVG